MVCWDVDTRETNLHVLFLKEIFMFRNEAEKHWEYIQSLLIAAGINTDLTLHKHLYVEAMVHGFKHAWDAKGQTDKL